MSSRYRLSISGLTDTGRVRSHNEDYIRWDEDIGLAVVADGMGGHNAGEVASRMATERLFEILTPRLERALNLRPNKGLSRHATLLHRAINKANDAVYQAARREAAYVGMGTTLVATLFYANKVVIAHIGDSRCYRFRNGLLERLTSDHSFAQEMVDKGASEELIQSSPYRNTLTRAVGVKNKVKAEIRELEIAPGDRFLLCSDGLTGMLDDPAISTLLQDGSADQVETVGRLVKEANLRGGADNLSVLIAGVSE